MNEIESKKPADHLEPAEIRAPRIQTASAIPWLATALVLSARLTQAQEGIRNAIANQSAAVSRTILTEGMPYTLKQGDFRMALTPALRADFNDNVNASHSDQLSDEIIRPSLGVNLSYPVTQNNLLQLNAVFGYDYYCQHNSLSTWRITSGSQLSFDIYVKDVVVNLHDRFSYMRDTAQEAAVANTANYGNFNNTAGLSLDWALKRITFTLGYDHQNTISGSSEFASQDHSTELPSTRIGYLINPTLSAGLEGTVAFTTYDQPVLNNNTMYSAGAYAMWHPGPALSVTPRGGYVIAQFDQTSDEIQTADVNTWYLDLSLTHAVTDAISYSFSGGHELRLGISADVIEDTYIRPSVTWHLIRNLTLTTYGKYEHGTEGVGGISGSVAEKYDWFGVGVGLVHALTARLDAGVNYRATIRSSTEISREYTQNIVGFELTYHP